MPGFIYGKSNKTDATHCTERFLFAFPHFCRPTKGSEPYSRTIKLLPGPTSLNVHSRRPSLLEFKAHSKHFRTKEGSDHNIRPGISLRLGSVGLMASKCSGEREMNYSTVSR